MIILFLLIVAVSIPNFWIFNDFDGGDRGDHDWIFRLSIAQLGFAKALCRDTSLGTGKLRLNCYAGQIQTIHSFGVIPSDGAIQDACVANEETIDCESSYDK